MHLAWNDYIPPSYGYRAQCPSVPRASRTQAETEMKVDINRPSGSREPGTHKGQNPLASLFQGTGALATFVTGLACALLLRHGPARSSTTRLFLIWMTYNGFFLSLLVIFQLLLRPGVRFY